MPDQTKDETGETGRPTKLMMATWRIPRPLHARLKEASIANGANLTEEVVRRLQESFELHPRYGLGELATAFRERLDQLGGLDEAMCALTNNVIATYDKHIGDNQDALQGLISDLRKEHEALAQERARREALITRDETLLARQEAAMAKLEATILKMEGTAR